MSRGLPPTRTENSPDASTEDRRGASADGSGVTRRKGRKRGKSRKGQKNGQTSKADEGTASQYMGSAADDGSAVLAEGGHSGGPLAAPWEAAEVEAMDLDIDPEELRDFLAADLLEVQADPTFEENLRRKLWRIVRTRYGPGSTEPD